MADTIEKVLEIPSSILQAENIKYDNTESGLEATNAQDAIDEVAEKAQAKITDVATGSNPTANNSANSNLIYFKDKGYTEQKTLSGKNLLKNTATTQTICGVTFTVNEDGSVKANGTATSMIMLQIGSFNVVANTKYIISGCPSGGSKDTYYVHLNGMSESEYDTGNGGEYQSFSDYTDCTLQIIINNGVTVNNLTFYPMVRLASVTDATYEPFCGGVASPNPEYPQYINGLADKGYFGGELLQGAYTDNGTINSNSVAVSSKNHIECVEGDVIALTYEEVVTRSGGDVYPFYIRFYDIDKNFISRVNSDNSTNNIVVTAPTNAKSFLFTIAQDTALTPTTAKHICVTINGMYAVRVKTYKEMFDGQLYAGYYSGTTGVKGATSNGTTICSDNYMEISESDVVELFYGEKTTQIWISFYDSEKKYLSRIVTTSNIYNPTDKISGTAPTNAKYFTFTISREKGITVDTAKSISIRVSSQSTTALIPVSAPLYEGDYIEVYADGSGQIVRENYSGLLPKSGWAVTDETNSKQANIYSANAAAIFGEPRQEFLSSHFGNTNTNKIVYYRGSFWAKFPSEYTTEEITNIFANNDIMYVGKLAEPVTEPLTAEQVSEFMKLQTFKPVTHVTADGEVTVRYYCNNDSGETVAMIQEAMLPIGAIIQVDENFAQPNYGVWQYLGTSKVEYENGGAVLLQAKVYKRIK